MLVMLIIIYLSIIINFRLCDLSGLTEDTYGMYYIGNENNTLIYNTSGYNEPEGYNSTNFIPFGKASYRIN